MRYSEISITFLAFATVMLTAVSVITQEPNERDKQKVRTVTIPISIYTKKELQTDQTEEIVQADRLIVREDKQEQTILSIRSVSGAPLEIAVLIQDNLTSTINLQLKDIKDFIRRLPKGTRVMDM